MSLTHRKDSKIRKCTRNDKFLVNTLTKIQLIDIQLSNIQKKNIIANLELVRLQLSVNSTHLESFHVSGNLKDQLCEYYISALFLSPVISGDYMSIRERMGVIVPTFHRGLILVPIFSLQVVWTQPPWVVCSTSPTLTVWAPPRCSRSSWWLTASS